MAHIIDLGWNNKYAVPTDFDLNILKDFVKVDEHDDCYIANHSDRGVTILLNKSVDLKGGLVSAEKYNDEMTSHSYTKQDLKAARTKIKELEQHLAAITATIQPTEEGGDI